jgi:preprotein translocase subunit SecA
VANDQRKVVYQQRTGILGATDLSDAVAGMRQEAINGLIDAHAAPQSVPADWDLPKIVESVAKEFNTRVDPQAWVAENPELDAGEFRQRLLAAVDAQYEEKTARIGAPLMRQIEREIVLRNLDRHWREHLAAMDYLRQGIHLRGYAQKDYRYEFKREAFALFSSMLDRVKHDTASQLSLLQVRDPAQVEREEAEQRERLMRALQAQHAEAHSALEAPQPQAPAPAGAPLPAGAQRPAGMPPPVPQAPFERAERKVGRNEPCPCGSGKKFKQCHGSLSA